MVNFWKKAKNLSDSVSSTSACSSDPSSIEENSSNNHIMPNTVLNDHETVKIEPTFEKYRQFRDELFTFALGESAFDYAESLFKEHPDSPEIMALLAETTLAYEKTKNKAFRNHWVDRMDLLQRGIDVSRKCINDYPEFGPCYQTYVIAAARAAESVFFLRIGKGIGIMESFHPILKRGKQAMELMPDDAGVPNALGALCGRCAHPWYSPYRWFGLLLDKTIPNEKKLREMSIQFHLKAVENDPGELEYACRLAQAYYMNKDFSNARRWFSKVRDEMPPRRLKDETWQALAHTQLSTGFTPSKWNVPFG